MQDDGIPAAGMFFNEFRQAVMSHVYHDIAFRLDDVVGSADDFIGVVGADIMSCVYEMGSPWAEESDAFFQAADDVVVFAYPAHYLLRPLEMDDVISGVRFPEFFLGASHINSSHSDSIA